MVSSIVHGLRWPFALVTLALTPAAAITLWGLLVAAYEVEFWASPFSIGLAVGFGLMQVFRNSRTVQFLATAEHELTHALFAWLTFVRVIEFWTGDGTRRAKGGAVGYVVLGGSNWLIDLAPYFFPTASALVMLATWTLASTPSTASHLLLGAATAWSIVSTWHETHAGQSDLANAGHALSWCFLPGANILSYGVVVSFALGGSSLAWSYATAVPHMTFQWLQQWMGW